MPQNMPSNDEITQNSKPTVVHNTLKSELGDNVRQYTANGLNSRREKWNIETTYLTRARFDVWTNMLDAVGSGVDYINWKPPGDSSTKKWTVTDAGYTIGVYGDDIYQITFSIEQEH